VLRDQDQPAEEGCINPSVERQGKTRPQRQRVVSPTPSSAVGRHACKRGFGFHATITASYPDGRLPRWRSANVIGSPIRHSVRLLRDVMTAILVRFEWHVAAQVRNGVLIHRPILAAIDRSVQQGRLRYLGFVLVASRAEKLGRSKFSRNTNLAAIIFGAFFNLRAANPPGLGRPFKRSVDMLSRAVPRWGTATPEPYDVRSRARSNLAEVAELRRFTPRYLR